MTSDTTTVGAFLALVNAQLIANRGWRRGQAVFNTAYELFPEAADDLRSTAADPFYKDERIDDFVNALVEKGALTKV